MGSVKLEAGLSGRCAQGGIVLSALVVLFLLLVPAALAAAPKFFTSFPEGGGGSAANELALPTALATDPGNGHVYVSEQRNARISEFTAWGEFVKTWGWGVVASGPDNDPQNEVQEVSLDAGVTGGSFKLLYRNAAPDGFPLQQTTTAINFNAAASSVQEALDALPSLAPGDVAVTGGAGGPWTIEFVGAYADTDVVQMEITGSTLVGGGATVETVQGGASFEVCDPAAGDVCRRGQRAGASPGQIVFPKGLAVDPAGGALYVYEGEKEAVKSLRVQKFSLSNGEFLTMFGGEVNKTTTADVCSKADLEGGDVCGAGVPGIANGQFNNTIFSGFGGNITVDATGTVYVGDVDRIQKFSSTGVFQASLPLPAPGTSKALAFDSASGDLYFAFWQATSSAEPLQPDVYRLDTSTGAVLDKALVNFPMSLATDPSGNLFVVAQNRAVAPVRDEVIEFDASGEPVIPLGEGFDPAEGPADSIGTRRPGVAVNSGCGTVGIYVANTVSHAIDAYGPTPEPSLCPPPPSPPTITDQFAVSVGGDYAVVKAKINPRFWEDTRYYVQYGTADCKLGGCAQTPLGPGNLLPEAGVSQALPTAGVTIPKLQPGTTYHYRFVAQSSGGGPVFGIGEEEAGATFRTKGVPGPDNVDCPNQALRKGAAASLADCRAYEMVSPVDKGGGNVAGRDGPVVLDQSALDGGRFTFSTYRAFDDAESSMFYTQYLSTRTDGKGWSTNSISPPNGVSFVSISNTLVNDFKAFSNDLCSSWFTRISNPPLTGTAPESFSNVYSQQDCVGGAPGYAAMITGEVQGAPTAVFSPELQGLSFDGSVAVFRANGQLTEDASSTPEQLQVYAAANGSLQLVSVMPNGESSPLNSTAGTKAGVAGVPSDSVPGAVSADGTRIYWSQVPTGRLFVRVDGTETRPVSETVSASAAQFWTASEDGSVAYFTIGQSLYEYDLAAESSTLVAGQVPGVFGASADASRLYFASREALAGGATAGQPNLYLSDGGSLTFVATVAALDVNGNLPNPANREPTRHLSRVSDDGLHLVFMSTSKSLSEATAGYDNTDANSGEPDAQVYVFDATSDQLNCVSCDPTGARPNGRLLATGLAEDPDLWASSEIPGWPSQLYASRVISEGGQRLFFNSYVSLSPKDTNEAKDVYQWETPGTGDCTEASQSFTASAGGCVTLLSSGKSDQPSEFVDADSDGADVFFSTEESLVGGDPGQVDIYDARVGGGFAEAQAPPDCVGEACQPAPAPPTDPVPSTPDFHGSGNVKEGSPSRKCPKGKHKVKKNGKTRCVKNHKKKPGSKGKRSHANRRAGR